jgi:hypothetical protein
MVGDAGAPLSVGSTVAVLAAVLRNAGQPWFRLVALGAALNLLVMVANGGVMPVDPAAFASAGLATAPAGTFSNTAPMSAASLWFLGDIWATPAWLPFANVISIGDVLIGSGVAAWVVAVMRRERPRALATAIARA